MSEKEKFVIYEFAQKKGIEYVFKKVYCTERHFKEHSGVKSFSWGNFTSSRTSVFSIVEKVAFYC